MWKEDLKAEEIAAVALYENCRQALDAVDGRDDRGEKRDVNAVTVQNVERIVQFFNDVRRGHGHARMQDTWSDKYLDLVRMLIDSSLKLRATPALKIGLQTVLGMVSQKHKVHAVGSELLYLQTAAQGEIEKVAQTNAATASEDDILALLSGIPRAELALRRHMDSTMTFYMNVINTALGVIRDNVKYETYYQKMVQNAFLLFRTYDRRFEFQRMSKTLDTHTVHTFDRGARELEASEEAQQAIVETRLVQLECAIALRHWRQILTIVEEFHRICANLRKMQKPPRQDDVRRHWQLLAKVLLASENYKYHAFALNRFARSIRSDSADIGLAASQCCLAALCVPNVAEPTHLQNTSRDSQHQKDATLAKAFGLTLAPTREWLLTQLYKPSKELLGRCLMDFVSPDVRAVHQSLASVSSVLACRDIAPLIQKIQSHPTLQQYVAPLKDFAVRSLLDIVAKSFSRVTIDYLCQLCHFYPRDTFSTTLEPILLETATDDSGAIVSIDYGAGAVNFVDSAASADRAASVQSQLTHELALAAAKCFAMGGAASTVKAPTFPGAVQAIESERDRILARNAICRLRESNAEERLRIMKENEEKKREEAQKRKEDAEKARISKQRQRERAKIAKQVEEEESRERRKWVLKALSQKYKGFEAPLTLASLPADKFANAVSDLLVSFRRSYELRRESDVRLMDHFERSCREVEIPLLKEREAALAESTRAEQRTRRENMLRKHREDYEKAVGIKQRLLKLQGAKAAYEKELTDVLQSRLLEKTRKRDDEQAELDRMMREREERAGGGAAASAAAAQQKSRKEEAAEERPAPAESRPSPPPSASPPPAVDALPSTAGRWVPKSLKKAS